MRSPSSVRSVSRTSRVRAPSGRNSSQSPPPGGISPWSFGPEKCPPLIKRIRRSPLGVAPTTRGGSSVTLISNRSSVTKSAMIAVPPSAPALYRTRTSISPTLQSPGSTAAARSRFRTAVRISQVEKGSSSAPLQRRQRLQHLLVVAVDADLLPHLAHGSRGVDQEGRALDAHGLLAVHVLLAPGAIGFGDLVIGVGE